jgi:subfamily B ATP-binding cassette protein MsbA
LSPSPSRHYTFYSYRSRLRIASIDLQARKAIVSGTLQERLSGIRVVQSFTREKTEDRRLFSQARDVFDRTLQRASLGGQLNAIATAMTGVGMASIVWFGCTKFLAGQLSSGAFVEFYALMGFLYGPLRDLSDVGETIQGALGALDRIFGLLSTPTAVEEKPGAIALPRCTGHVRFEHVSFAYRQGEAVLHDVDFEAQRGQVIAVVGPSGSGKTTLVHLILRFYDPTSGRILIDGYDIADATLFSLRQQIGIVSQDPFLFSGTIEENIGYGRKHASHEEVIAAAKAANAHEFIITLPEGYRTEVGERGVRLSGGQKQRIAIARAILRDPAILILDEATSSVDSKSENLIQSALDNLMLGRTTFIVAHRLSTIMKADVILVMEEGRIIETGRHAELLVKGGLYASLCREQFQAAPEALGIDLTSSFPHN